MNYETILYQKKGYMADIILNRPDKMNAINFQMVGELHAALQDAEDDVNIKVIIISGAGDKAFTSGDDIGAKDREEWWEWAPGKMYVGMRRKHFFHLIGFIRSLMKPVIAQVHGYCLGSGPELAIACDLVIAAETAKFGIYMGWALLPRVVGYHKAIELIATGRKDFIDGREAERIGLVTRAVPREQLRNTVTELAEKLAEQATIGWIKWAFNRAIDSNSVDEALDFHVLSVGLTHISKYLPNPNEIQHH